MNKWMYLILLMIPLISVVSAADTSDVSNALEDLKGFFCGIMPIAIVLMIAAGAVLFAVGSLLGAEQRAKTRVWAMNMFIYAGVAVLLYVLVPWLLNTIAGNSASFSC